MFLFFIIPGILESYLHYYNITGNMGLHGVCLELFYKRNLFYFLLFTFLLCYIFNFYYYILLFFVFLSFVLFTTSYYKWKPYFKIYIQ